MLDPLVTLRHPIRKPVMMHTYTTNSERTSISAVNEYFTDNTFELYNAIVVMQICSNTKRQRTMQEQLPKVGRKY